MTSEYCRKVCKGARCPECPAPDVLGEAQPGIAAYTVCQTQWRMGFGGRSGLDYAACRVELRARLPEWRERFPEFADMTENELFADLQAIETAMLSADNERRQRDESQRDTHG